MPGNEGDTTTRETAIRCSQLNPVNSQVHGSSSDSFALPSQPFDLRNWFSSYEYESPECSGLPNYLGSYLLSEEKGEIDTQEHALDSCLDDKFTGLVEEGEIDAQDHVLESSPDAKVIASVEEGQIDNQEHPLESSLDAKVNDLVVEHEGKHSAKHDSVGECQKNCDISRTSGILLVDKEQSSIRLPGVNDLKEQEKVPSLIFDEEVPGLRLEIKQDGLHSTRTEKNTASNSSKVAAESVSVKNLKSCGHSECEESIYLKPKVADVITGDMEVNENLGTNSFISTKNSRNSGTDDGPFHTKFISTMNCNKNYEKQTGAKTLQENNQTKSGKRNALMDKTNVFEGEADTVPEITGKWQCPRMNKPYMGPPLKQLRMEQWFHRVNKDHSIR
ncbi:uncharacterized protein LOC120259267 [Dioscorea cayenensis subsp. rotundata]|uniref:Uncharacterized protein LOC120259267 n=1 Tax=Dioscorea cayennensis subsp. rotundata TaxID=55577 RepID=A0AB40B6D0_DIOCR|nr:uncharacterized protein LOC120259267 [Dioscorea cayenensis subsp. rotundata]